MQTPQADSASAVYQALLTRVGEANPRPRIEPARRLAELAGSPQLDFAVIQVAGTNGKTSTARAIESLLRAHGMKTGLFTSPHLIDFTERFVLNGEVVAEGALVEAWVGLQLPLQVTDEELRSAGMGPITFFEALAVLAYLLFADAPVDVAVIEVGMGGEWDATNIADAQIAVFTPIHLDHTNILGTELEQIAATKAGIIKADSTVVTAKQHPAAFGELSVKANELGVRLINAQQNFDIVEDRLAVGGRQLELRGITGHHYEPVFVPLFGQHQAENVAVAIAAVEAFLGAERPLPTETLEEGLAQLTSPGRLQLIGAAPIVYVDGAHNPHGAEALAQAVTESFAFTELTVIVGVVNEKDSSGILEALSPIADRFIFTSIDSDRSSSPTDLEGVLDDRTNDAGARVSAQVVATLAEALEVARDWARDADGRAVLVTGSVLLAGEAIALSRAEGWGVA